MPKSINKGVIAIPVVVASALMLMTPMLVSAQNPHFVRASSSLSGNDLVCSFKEAGLGGGTTVTIECSAEATAEYQCINRGEKNPSAANKRTVEEDVDASGDFTAAKNGQITDSVTVHPPSAGDFTCPPGQQLRLISVAYTNVEICDITNNICQPLPSRP